MVLRYVDNPNGSVDDIAGMCNEAGNVVGLMPHPERASDPLLGSVDGSVLLRALCLGRCSDRHPPDADRHASRRVGRARGRSGRPSAAGAGDLGLLEHGGAHADRPPGRVGDALALAVDCGPP